MNTKQLSDWNQLVRQCKAQCARRPYNSINVASIVRSEAIVAADALVELVTLLEQMADYAREAARCYETTRGSPDDVDGAYIAEETARELAAQIREILDEH